MRDPATYLGRQRRVGGPHRLHQALAQNLFARNDTHARSELLASNRCRFDLDLNVVIAVLGAPRAQRVFPVLIS